ncbi:MAG: AMP-binding protein [Actinobacteria bacterium]|nr:AMP-binding protein [Actinomycetota bacterium]
MAGSPLLYTGGTTGASKGVVRSDSGMPIPNWVVGVSMWGGFVRMPEAGVMLIATPLYHAFGSGVLGAPRRELAAMDQPHRGPVPGVGEAGGHRPARPDRRRVLLQVSVVDDDGNDLPAGEVGTWYFRRADGSPTYHGDEAKTRAAQLPDGRFTVGDLGYLDDDGFMYLVDRPALTADELIAWCRERLANVKCPRSVDFHESLPREAHGKLKKRLLRDVDWTAS